MTVDHLADDLRDLIAQGLIVLAEHSSGLDHVFLIGSGLIDGSDLHIDIGTALHVLIHGGDIVDVAIHALGVQHIHSAGEVGVSGGGTVALGDLTSGGGGGVSADLAVQVLEGLDLLVVTVHHQAEGVLCIGGRHGVLLLTLGLGVHTADNYIVAGGVQTSHNGIPAVGDVELSGNTQTLGDLLVKRVQRFDPVGVAAKDLRDCLLIQLSQFDKATPWLEEARLIISDHLDLLANHDFRTLMRVTRLKEDVLKEAVNLIQSLDPRPGQSIQTGEPEYVIPDVLVRKHNDRWVVELNSDSIPRLQINQHYAAMCNSARNDADSQFIRSNLQDAKWLIKSLESRNDTLLRVSRCIVEQQQAFFEQGEEFMKPMVLADIAQAVEMHESTISRVTTQKYLHSPRGIFELKYFFSSHVNTEGGGEASSTAIRALVKKLIAAENPAKPLSDSKLTSMLSEQGIMVARRTVAKYRESLSIPPSNQRKQLV